MGTLKQDVVFDLEYFFKLSPDLLCIAGYDGYFKKINPAVTRTLGYTQEELMAAPINSFVHPDDQEITARKRQGLTRGEELLEFENRYIAKDGSIIWLSWTSVPVKRDNVIFAIAKNISYRKQLEEYDRIAAILEMIHDDRKKRFKKRAVSFPPKFTTSARTDQKKNREEPSHADQQWLNSFESIVRKYIGRLDLNLSLISDELAMSERHLFRRVNQVLGITPNKLVRVIRMQLAWEAIGSGKYRTITEISNIAGYNSRAHFSKLFKEIYGIDVLELL